MEIVHEISTIDMIMKKVLWDKGNKYVHWHEKIEIIQCMGKSFDAVIDGVHYQIHKGDILLIGPHIIHYFIVPEDNTEIRLGQFPFSILLSNGITPSPVQSVITAKEYENNPTLSFQINSLFEIALETPAVEAGTKKPFSQCILSGLYFLLMENFPMKDSDNSSKKEKQDFYKILNYINSHFTENITVQSVSKELFIDRGRLSKIFTKYAGTSLSSYINTLRVNKAIQLIEDGNGITVAALESGFQSVRTFNDVYKKITNSLPSKITNKNK